MPQPRKNPDLSVSPLVAVVLVTVVVLLVGAKMWAAGEAAGVDVPNDLRTAPDGRLAVLHGRQLYLGDPDAGDAERIDLAELGAGRRLADFDFFPDGDVLIWRADDDAGWFAGLLEGLRTLAGKDLGNADASTAHVARCDLETRSCEPFLSGPQAPRPPYGVAIADDGTVYMSDTAEHRVLVVSEAGERRHGFDDDLWYPNGLWLAGDRLLLANTDERELVELATAPSFGTDVSRHAYDSRKDMAELRPTALAAVNDGWWVVSIGPRLTGAAVERLGPDWRVLGPVALGDGAEPTTVLPHGDSVYVADAGRFRVARFAPDGTPRGQLAWPALERDLADARAASIGWTWTGHAAWTLFIALLAAGLLVGYRQGGLSAAAVDGVPLSAIGLDASDPRIHWLERGKGTPVSRRGLLLVSIALCLLALLPLLLAGLSAETVKIAGLALVLAAFTWFGLAPILGARIGVHEGWLILDNGRRQIAGRGDAIDYSDEGLAIDEVAVPLGRGKHGLFRKEELEEHVTPLLRRGTKISKSWMQLRMLRSYPASSATFGLLIVGFLAWLGFYGPFV